MSELIQSSFPKERVALLYDFDKTLCPLDMQEYGFLPRIGKDAKSFFSQADSLSDTQVMDMILASMYMMLEAAKENGIEMTRSFLQSCGSSIEFYPGIPDWFERMTKRGDALGIEVEHYIISSGLKEIIEGSGVAHCFKEIFASEYFYDKNGMARWPLNSVNYTGKTQYLFRINKGILDISDDHVMSAYIPHEQRRVPFQNMIYIGDGLTDIPCMKLVRSKGGYSIAVHPKDQYHRVDFLQRQGRVNFTAVADYREGAFLDELVEGMLHEMAHRSRMNLLQLEQETQNQIQHHEAVAQ